MKNSIWILGFLLFTLCFVCEAQGEDKKPPRCDRCKDACQFAEDVEELEMLRILYQSKEIRLEAAATKGHAPGLRLNQLVQRELNKWFRKGNGKYCNNSTGKSKTAAPKSTKNAEPFLATNNTTCIIDPDMTKKAREKYCEARLRYYLNHEQHHVNWCKAGKADPTDGDSYDDFNLPCYPQWRDDRNDAKEQKCNLKVINALGDEEVEAYDLALREARMELKQLYLKCGMKKSADALQEKMDKEEFEKFKEIYELLGVWL